MQKKIVYVFVILAGGLVGLYFYNKYKVAPKIELFSKEIFDAEGKQEKNISEILKGKKIIVTYSTSWCRDCLIEMKQLNELKSDKLKDVEIVVITDESPEKLVAFKEKHNYPFRFYRITKQFSEIGVASIPVVYLISTKGKTVYEKVGAPDWENQEFVKQALRMME
ncbi:MAG: TlpA family protein disulfide reductase [Bacteroidia bacterium]|nr:TlpA family protein disulfide reductase [Bacteroidia bacterium]